MLSTLLESRRRAPRRRTAAILSGCAHGVLVIALVMSRRDRAPEGLSKPVTASIVFIAPQVPLPEPPSVVRRSGTAPTARAPELPRLAPVIVERPLLADLLDRARLRGELHTTLPMSPSFVRDSMGPAVEDVMTAVAVDQQVEIIPGQRPPHYPPHLERAGVAGDVVAQFVVDTTGRVERGSVRIQQATRAEFARAVEERVAGLRFVPARARGRRVRQLVEQRFHFEVVRRAK